MAAATSRWKPGSISPGSDNKSSSTLDLQDNPTATCMRDSTAAADLTFTILWLHGYRASHRAMDPLRRPAADLQFSLLREPPLQRRPLQSRAIHQEFTELGRLSHDWATSIRRLSAEWQHLQFQAQHFRSLCQPLDRSACFLSSSLPPDSRSHHSCPPPRQHANQHDYAL